MVQVVDPATRIRIDVFPDLVGSISRAVETTVADEKHVQDAMLLGRLCGRQIDPLAESVMARPVYEKDLTSCARCEASRSPDFPIASRQRVFEILGYN